MCPVYLQYGMSYDLYWNGPPSAARDYREAYKLQIKAKNEMLWLQGLYNFNAFSTALSNMNFDGKHRKKNKYIEKPIEIFEKTEEEKKQEAVAARQKVIDTLNKWKRTFNNRKDKNGNS